MSHPSIFIQCCFSILRLKSTCGTLCVKEPIETFAEMEDSDVQDTLIREFNSLSVVYGKPSETFLSRKHGDEFDDDEEIDDVAEAPAPVQYDEPVHRREQPTQAPPQGQEWTCWTWISVRRQTLLRHHLP